MEHTVEAIRLEVAKYEYIINQYLTMRPFFYMNQVRFGEPEILLLEEIFPVDSKKLLKMGLSLGNLLKSGTGAMSKSTSNNTLNSSTGSSRRASKISTTTTSSYSLSTSITQNLKFVNNLYKVLRSFDIDGITETKSPSKLSPKHLLIEKLEVNTNLDNLFTVKCVMKLVVDILYQLSTHLDTLDLEVKVSDKNRNSSQSIRNVATTAKFVNDYNIVLQQIIFRLNKALVEPLMSRIHDLAMDTMVNEMNQLNNLFVN